MSYAFDMSFAMAVDEKEAFVLARHYVEKCMEKKNARKFIEDNTIYIPSIRYSHIEKANNMADVADRYWLENLFIFRSGWRAASRSLRNVLRPLQICHRVNCSIYAKIIWTKIQIFRIQKSSYICGSRFCTKTFFLRCSLTLGFIPVVLKKRPHTFNFL